MSKSEDALEEEAYLYWMVYGYSAKEAGNSLRSVFDKLSQENNDESKHEEDGK